MSDRAVVDMLEQRNVDRFHARAEQMRRRHHKDLHKLNSRRDGAGLAQTSERSVPSGPSAVGVIKTLALLTVLGLVVVPLVGGGVALALSRWGWDRISKSGRK